MEHAQLVVNAIARFESLLRPMLAAAAPEARRALSHEMIDWLAATSDSTLRAALLDRPCPVAFFQKWASAGEIKAWGVRAREDCLDSTANPCEAPYVRPSEFFQTLCAQKRT